MCDLSQIAHSTTSGPGDSDCGSPPPGRRPKNNRRRARRACLSCRARKVRCDVVERVPCGNCKWDNAECVVVSRRQGRYLRVNPPTKKTKQVPAEVQTHNGVEQPVVNHEVSEQKDTVSAPQNASVEHYGRSENLQYTAQMLRLLADYTGKPEEVILPERAQSKSPLQKQNSIAARSDFSDESQNSDLPRFVKSLEDRIATDDLEYLRAKGALTLPAVEFRDALIWSFFEHVHPLMPVLDLDQFLQPILDGDDESGQVSLLLYQAVLFAGTAHVKMEFLKEAGFKTRRHARKVLFQRVRLLYDFNAESDPVALVQAVLLMTLWYETPEEHRNTWHWIDVAISQAFAAGLHRDPLQSSISMSLRTQRLRRRLWWACFMRDRLVSLGMKRPPRIRDDEYSVSMMEEADFDLEKLGGSGAKNLCSYAQNTDKRRSLAKICIAKAGLCRCLRYYLRSRYSIFVENAGDETSEVLQISTPDDKAAFMSCNEDLLSWQNSLPDDCRYRPLSRDINQGVDFTVALSRAILHMIYYSAVAGLHRSRFTLLLHSQEASLFDQELSKICMQHAAIQISDMAGEIHRHGLDGYLPTMGLAVVVASAAVHLLEVRGMIHADRKRANEGYRRCMRVIDSLTDMYVAADLAKDAMECAFARSSSGQGSPSDVKDYSPVNVAMSDDSASSLPALTDSDCATTTQILDFPEVGLDKDWIMDGLESFESGILFGDMNAMCN